MGGGGGGGREGRGEIVGVSHFIIGHERTQLNRFCLFHYFFFEGGVFLDLNILIYSEFITAETEFMTGIGLQVNMNILCIKWSKPKVFDLRVVVRSVDSSSMLERSDQDKYMSRFF